MKWAILGVTIWACALMGCRSGSSWLPMEEGMVWTYKVRMPHYTYVEPVRVGRRTSVGTSSGYTIQSELGESRMAWEGGRLVASAIGHTSFEPPLPIFTEEEQAKPSSWRGIVVVNGKSIKAVATLSCQVETVTFRGAKHSARRSEVLVTYGGQRIEWSCWFVATVGIIRQEQRTNGELDLSLEMIRGT